MSRFIFVNNSEKSYYIEESDSPRAIQELTYPGFVGSCVTADEYSKRVSELKENGFSHDEIYESDFLANN